MKVLQVNSVYKIGSTGKIVHDIHHGLLDRKIESVVIYGRGDLIKDNNIHKSSTEALAHFNHAVSLVTGIMYGNNFWSTSKLISIIRKEKPDIVHLHCINGYFVNIYMILKWLKKNKIKTIITLHAEFMYTGGCGHAYDCDKWLNEIEPCGKCPFLKKEVKTLFFDRTRLMWHKMNDAFTGFDDNLVITSVSPWLMNRAMMSPILKGKKHFSVINGLDRTNIFNPKTYNDLLIKHNIHKKKIILHVTPYFDISKNHIKGGEYVVQLSNLLIENEVVIIVVGKYDPNINYPNNMLLVGRIDDQELLAKYYSMANITLLTSKRETFSMVTAESLSCGTPVVGFASGGPEVIALKEYSSFVPFGDINYLKNEVLAFLDRSWDKNNIFKDAQIYSKENMVNNYIKIYKELK